MCENERERERERALLCKRKMRKWLGNLEPFTIDCWIVVERITGLLWGSVVQSEPLVMLFYDNLQFKLLVTRFMTHMVKGKSGSKLR